MPLMLEQVALLPFESKNLLVEAQDVLGDDADRWLDAPFVASSDSALSPADPSSLWKTRRDVIAGTDEELKKLIREELRRVRLGIPN